MDTYNWVLAAFPEIVEVILHTSEEEDQEERDRDDCIWEDDSDVPLLSSQMMPFGVGPSDFKGSGLTKSGVGERQSYVI